MNLLPRYSSECVFVHADTLRALRKRTTEISIFITPKCPNRISYSGIQASACSAGPGELLVVLLPGLDFARKGFSSAHWYTVGVHHGEEEYVWRCVRHARCASRFLQCCFRCRLVCRLTTVPSATTTSSTGTRRLASRIAPYSASRRPSACRVASSTSSHRPWTSPGRCSRPRGWNTPWACSRITASCSRSLGSCPSFVPTSLAAHSSAWSSGTCASAASYKSSSCPWSGSCDSSCASACSRDSSRRSASPARLRLAARAFFLRATSFRLCPATPSSTATSSACSSRCWRLRRLRQQGDGPRCRGRHHRNRLGFSRGIRTGRLLQTRMDSLLPGRQAPRFAVRASHDGLLSKQVAIPCVLSVQFFVIEQAFFFLDMAWDRKQGLRWW